MTLRLRNIVLDAHDMARMRDFWREALGYRVVHDGPGWTVLAPQDADEPRLCLQPATDEKTEVNRLHLDLATAADPEAEVARLLGLGATRVAWPWYEDDSDFVVLADPEGNELCVVGPY